MKKIAEIDCCWICPQHEYKMAYPYCGKKRRTFPVGFDGQNKIPDWCPLPDVPKENPRPIERGVGEGR